MEEQQNLTKEEREKLHQKHIEDKIKSEKTKKLVKKVIIYSVIILIIAAIVYIPISSSKKPGKYDEFAKCLTEKGLKFYGSFQCPACARQKELFGKSMKYVNYVECGPLSGPQNQVCKDANVKVYPTWILEDEIREGVLQLDELAQWSSCSLATETV